MSFPFWTVWEKGIPHPKIDQHWSRPWKCVFIASFIAEWLREENGKFKFKNEFSQVLRLSFVELKAWQSIMAFFMVKNIKFDFSQPHTPSTVAYLFIYIIHRPPHTNQTNQNIKINEGKKENSIKIKWKKNNVVERKTEKKRKSENQIMKN